MKAKHIIITLITIFALASSVIETIYVIDITKTIPWVNIRYTLIALNILWCLAIDSFILYKIYKYLWNDKFY